MMSRIGGRLVVGLVALIACWALHEVSAAQPVTDVILVHGAWADGSSWWPVTGILQERNYNVLALQLGLRNLTEDVEMIRRAVINTGRPAVVVGHSYGGFMATVATGGLENVSALVYVAAFVPDEGESVASLIGRFEPAPLVETLLFDEQGFVTIPSDAYHKFLADGVKPATARILFAALKPTFGPGFSANATTPGWVTIPSYYQISTQDKAINPDLQRFMAERIKPVETMVLETTHMSFITHPEEVAGLIIRASTGTTKATGKTEL